MTFPIKKTSQGPDVQQLQNFLKQNGYPLDIDGIFGTQTYNAVRAFQYTEPRSAWPAFNR